MQISNQIELRDKLLADIELAFEWYSKTIEDFTHTKFVQMLYRVSRAARSRLHYEDYKYEFFMIWYRNSLPYYKDTENSLKYPECYNLASWSRFCIKRRMISFFNQFKARKYKYLHYASYDDIFEDNPKSQLDIAAPEIEEDIHDDSDRLLKILQMEFTPLLSRKEKKLWDAYFDLVRANQHENMKNWGIPNQKLSETTGLALKEIDNGLYRMRRKLHKFISKLDRQTREKFERFL